jgi:hypothetical protein
MASGRHQFGWRLLLVANLLVANAAAALWVVTFVQPGAIGSGPGLDQLGAGRVAILHLGTGWAWGAVLAAVLLLLANFAWLVRRRDRQVPPAWILSDTGAGPVRIAREALEAGLQKAGEALPEVTRLRVHVDHALPKRIVVRGQFHCAEHQNHLAASQRLRQALADRFASMVRLSEGARIEYELEFQGFLGRLSKKAGEIPPVEDTQPFTGPRYPIDDEGPDQNA